MQFSSKPPSLTVLSKVRIKNIRQRMPAIFPSETLSNSQLAQDTNTRETCNCGPVWASVAFADNCSLVTQSLGADRKTSYHQHYHQHLVSEQFSILGKKAEESTDGPLYPPGSLFSDTTCYGLKILGGKCAFNELVISPHTVQNNNDVQGICTVLGIRGNRK